MKTVTKLDKMKTAFFSYFVFSFIFIIIVRCEIIIDDFEKSNITRDVSSWKDYSDSKLASSGKSISSFIIQEGRSFRQAVLFTLVNPQSCGAAITGIMKNVSLDLTNYTSISMRIKGQGEYTGYEFILRHNKQHGSEISSFVHYFEAPQYFQEVTLPIDQFILYHAGVPVENPEPLNRSDVTTVGILTYAGAKRPVHQRGVAALQIRWIKIK